MAANDLIEIEFVNLDGREVMIPPVFAPEIANALRSGILPIFREMTSDDLELDLLLTGAQRGSLKLLFRPVAKSLRDRKDELQGAANIATALSAVAAAAVYVYTGIATGSLLPSRPVPQTEVQAAIDKAEKSTTSHEVMQSWQGLLKRADNCGADEVWISVPDAPRCQLAIHSSTDTFLIGSMADPGSPASAPSAGRISLTGEELRLNIGLEDIPEPIDTYVAVMFEDGSDVPTMVLVTWGSKRPLPKPGEEIQYAGDRTAIHSGVLKTIYAMSPVGPGARRAVYILNVRKQLVAE